ncbi:DUF6009 family protein [Streptomyces sp. 09ZI22]|uniref:DUF6009 family protein n=1 Tax=Streptomyces sp. 09ZI22 TaxID=2856603 RepID=UPI00214B2B95|nr:DUF6009 family protein [Streptomyces sp. 09ZI22]
MQAVPDSGDGLPVVSDGGHRGDRRNRLSGCNLESELRPALGLAPTFTRRLRQRREVRNVVRTHPAQQLHRQEKQTTHRHHRLRNGAKRLALSHDPLPPRRPCGRLRRPHAAPDSGLQNQRPFHLLPPGRDAELHRLHRAGVPGEAVDTRTIRPGQAGCRTAPLQQGKKVTDARIGSSAPHPSHACCS